MLSCAYDDVVCRHKLKDKGFVLVFGKRHFVFQFMKDSPKLFLKLYFGLVSIFKILSLSIWHTWWSHMPLSSVKINGRNRSVKFLVDFVVSKVEVFHLGVFCIIVVEEFIIREGHHLKVVFLVENCTSRLVAYGLFEWSALEVSELDKVRISFSLFVLNSVFLQIV